MISRELSRQLWEPLHRNLDRVIAVEDGDADPLAGITGIVQRYRYTDITSGIGNPVDSWPNIGTQGGSAIGTIGMRPTLEAEGVRMNGTSDFLDMLTLASLSEGSLFILAKNDFDPGTLASNGPWIGNSGTDPTSNHTPFSDGNIYDDWGSTSRKTVGNPTDPLTDWFIYEVSSNDGYWEAWLNSVSLFVTASNTVGFGASPTMGADGSAFWAGLIREVIIVDRASPTIDGDRTIIRDYLNSLMP